MRKLLCSAVALASLCDISSAQTITQTFGTGATAFSIDFVQIGNLGNAADSRNGVGTKRGAVNYVYSLAKYEISRDMVLNASKGGGLGLTLADMIYYNGVNKAATGISWNEAAMFVNFLNTTFGSTLAYKFDGNGNYQVWSPGDVGYNPSNQFRNSLAKYFLPSTDEWYKGAFGTPSGSWNNFATGNLEPTAVSNGTANNTMVYAQIYDYNIPLGPPDTYPLAGPSDTISAGGLSAWGTMAQGGNAREWVESAVDGSNDTAAELRSCLGGAWNDLSTPMWNGISLAIDPSSEISTLGFRVAMIPEPSSLSLLALGGVVVALRKCKRV
jgi:hypothetical protein